MLNACVHAQARASEAKLKAERDAGRPILMLPNEVERHLDLLWQVRVFPGWLAPWISGCHSLLVELLLRLLQTQVGIDCVRACRRRRL